MSCRVDTAPLIAGACIVSLYAGHGVRGDAVPSAGTHGPSPVYNDLALLADATKEYRWAITTPPSAGSIVAYEDCSYAYTPPIGTTNLTVTYGYRLWEDGADKGTATETIIIGAGSGGGGGDGGFVPALKTFISPSRRAQALASPSRAQILISPSRAQTFVSPARIF